MLEVSLRVRRIINDPLVLFLIMGGLIFAAFSCFEEADKALIKLSSETRQSLIENHEMLVGREISVDEIALLEKEYIDKEILFNEAIERRLYLYDGRAKEAMIERLQFELTGSLPSSDQGDLINYYSDNVSLYMAEPEFSFKHVFFNERPDHSEDVLMELEKGQAVTGDQFWQGDIFPEYGASVIRSLFDQEFLAVLRNADFHEWFGPLETNTGFHFVYLEAKKEPRLMSYMEVRDQVKNDYLSAEQKKVLNSKLVQLKNKYDIQIEN